jgi:hypothetical protein
MKNYQAPAGDLAGADREHTEVSGKIVSIVNEHTTECPGGLVDVR